MKQFKKILVLFSILLGFLLFPSGIFAQGKTIIYDVQEDSARVTYQITLTNENTKTYIAKYTLSTGLTSIENLSAKTDAGVNLGTEITDSQGYQAITITFPQYIGEQSTINWNLSFTTAELLDSVGKLKELTVPGFSGDDEIDIIVNIPKSIGDINYFSSAPSNTEDTDNTYSYTFSDPIVKDQGIFLLIGDTQIYDFTFRYELENNEDTRIRTTISLPPDYKNQKIYFNSFSPLPDNAYKDQDGNYIVEYVISQGESYEVEINGKAVISNEINGDYFTELEDATAYLKSDVYWEVDAPAIFAIAAKLTEGKETTYEKAKAIYDFVTTELSYNDEALGQSDRERLGAQTVLNDKSNAICQEYTDLFVALSRASGIPARMLSGYTTAGKGYELPENTLHAWAEFYDEEKGWITVDPTWGSTSEGYNFFDNVGLDHFILGIRGYDSQKPHQVLSFIPTDDTSDNLVITPTAEEPEVKEEISVTTVEPEATYLFLNNVYQLTLRNDTNRMLSISEITTTTKNESISAYHKPTIDSNSIIVPGEEIVLKLNIRTNQLKEFETEVNTVIDGITGAKSEFKENINLSMEMKLHPWFIYTVIAIAIVITSIVVVILILIVRGIRKKKGNTQKIQPKALRTPVQQTVEKAPATIDELENAMEPSEQDLE